MKFLRIRNFEKFQHYRDRRPPWIKLYRDLWNDPRFFELTESDRYFLISFFVIASQNDNRIPNNDGWLKREMATRRVIPVDALVNAGWLEWCEQEASIQDASRPLAVSVHDADIVLSLAHSREQERETETEIQRENTEAEVSPVVLSKPKRTAKPKTQAPVNLDITLNDMDWAYEAGFSISDVERETPAMLDHFRGTGGMKQDWIATWRNWMRNSRKFNGGNNGRTHQGSLESKEQAKVRRNIEAAGFTLAEAYGEAGDWPGSGDHAGTGDALPPSPFGPLRIADKSGV